MFRRKTPTIVTVDDTAQLVAGFRRAVEATKDFAIALQRRGIDTELYVDDGRNSSFVNPTRVQVYKIERVTKEKF